MTKGMGVVLRMEASHAPLGVRDLQYERCSPSVKWGLVFRTRIVQRSYKPSHN